jgi:hypothetical protein
VKELETLFQAINLSSTVRPDGLLESPIKNKLYKGAVQELIGGADPEQNKQFQASEENHKRV